MTWGVAFAQAVRENEALLERIDWSAGEVEAMRRLDGALSTSPVEKRVRNAIIVGEHIIRTRVRYDFRGEEHDIVSWPRCLQRGYAACADATAFLVVVVAFAGARRIELCLEEERTKLAYAHVRIVVDGYIADAYRDRRIDVDECSYLVDIDDVMGRGWHARVTAQGDRRRRG